MHLWWTQYQRGEETYKCLSYTFTSEFILACLQKQQLTLFFLQIKKYFQTFFFLLKDFLIPVLNHNSADKNIIWSVGI